MNEYNPFEKPTGKESESTECEKAITQPGHVPKLWLKFCFLKTKIINFGCENKGIPKFHTLYIIK